MGKEDAILGSTQLNKVIGMIIPPPETKNLIDRVAQLVAKYGLSVEEKMKNDPNPKFSFLKEGDPYSNYYEQRVIQIGAMIQKSKEEEDKAKEEQEVNQAGDLDHQSEFLNRKREAETNLDDQLNQEKESQMIDNERKNKLKEELRSFIKKKEQEINMANTNLNDIKAPKPDKFSISHPNIPGLDMDIIKIVAQFVARNGQRFLSELSERESKNSQFHFLKPQHNLFGYFTYLVSSYSEILHNKKEEINKLVSFSSNRNDILKQAMNRVLYEKKLKNLQKIKGSYDDADNNKRKTQIDWYDFVVVDTIDFYEESQFNLEEPIETEIKNDNAVNAKEDEVLIETIQAKAKNQPKVEQELETDEDELQKENNANPNAYNDNDNTTIINQQGIKIRKSYIRQTINNNNTEDEEMIKCPLCKESIAKSILDDHMRIELLYPKWKETQKELSKRTETTFIPQTISYLNDFINSRPDLYGDINDIQTIEEKRKREVKQQNSTNIWDGYNPNMTRTTANIKMFKQQNKKHIEESKRRNENQQ